MKKLFLFFLMLIFLASCNSVKRVPEKEHLLTKNTVTVNGKKTKDETLNSLILQKPNNKTFGLPLSLYFYNLGDPNKPQTPSKWALKKPRTYNFIKDVFSEKQSIAYANSMIGINNWFLNSGQAPTIINDNKLKKTVTNLKSYYKTQGFFKASVTSKIDTLGNKKGSIDYFINTGNATFLDTINYKIESKILDSIYQKAKDKTFLRSGDQYNNDSFIKEAGRIIKLFRNNGIYHFSENYLGFYDLDSTNINYKTNVDLVINGQRIVRENGEQVLKPFKIQKLRNVNVFTDYSFAKRSDPYLDIVDYEGYKFIGHDKVKYNPKYLAQSLFIQPGDIYKDTLRNLTRKHLRSLRNFKSITIQYDTVANSDDQLDVNIFLTPTEKYTLGLETELTHSNIRDLGVSGKFSIINRNTFKGAEIFKLSFLGSFFNASQDANKSNNFFNSWEIGADVSLEVPRFLAPFGLNKLVPKRMNPRTMFSLGTSLQKNIGLDRQTVTAFIDYRWQYTPTKTIQLEIFNTQYIRNLNVSNYFDVYNSEYNKLNEVAKVYYNDPTYELLRPDEPVSFMRTVFTDTNFQGTSPLLYQDNLNALDRYNIITSDFLIPTIAYSYTYNNQTNFRDNDFSFFKVRLANSGNIMGLFSNGTNSNNNKTVFKIPLAQYFKTDIEYKKFWDTNNNSVFGIRAFLGAIFPYDNSEIPFTKSYFAGGSNDIRAWQTYDLGPGSRASGLEYNIGSLKFLTSAEYRFDLLGSLKGAFFVDAGNIWDITNSIFANDDAKFSSLNSLKDIAVGSGFGVRYDFSFLVLRLDLGFKMHEPYLNGNRWFRNYNFSSAVYNIGINYPF